MCLFTLVATLLHITITAAKSTYEVTMENNFFVTLSRNSISANMQQFNVDNNADERTAKFILCALCVENSAFAYMLTLYLSVQLYV